jgi:hypothetical protein
MPVRRLGAGHDHAQHLTCERAYSGYEIAAYMDIDKSFTGFTKKILLPQKCMD